MLGWHDLETQSLIALDESPGLRQAHVVLQQGPRPIPSRSHAGRLQPRRAKLG
jgi:hypothetical protein